MSRKLDVLIRRALEFLYKNDSYLISHSPTKAEEDNHKNHACERAIMFRFAHYMQMLMYMDVFFSKYSLDCEYNRNIDYVKALPTLENGVYPDIIIHERGSNRNNYAVIEIKTYWNPDQSFDRERIKLFMDPDGEYKYINGVLIMIGKSREEAVVEFI